MPLVDLVLFAFVLISSFIMSSSDRIYYPQDMLIFAETSDLLRQMKYSASLAFDISRNNLVTLMKSIDSIIYNMESYDEAVRDLLDDVYTEYIELANQIPICWEHNEYLLRQLVSFETMNLTYCIEWIIPESVVDAGLLGALYMRYIYVLESLPNVAFETFYSLFRLCVYIYTICHTCENKPCVLYVCIYIIECLSV